MGASAVSGIVSSLESVAVGLGGEQGPRVLDISGAGGRGYQASWGPCTDTQVSVYCCTDT